MRKYQFTVLIVTFFISLMPAFPQIRQATTVRKVRPLTLTANPWPNWCRQAMKATSEAVKIWTFQVRFTRGIINAPTVTAGPGGMKSPLLKNNLKAFLLSARVPVPVANGFAEGISGQWHKWQSGVTIPSLPLFPTLVNCEGPKSPLTKGIPTHLSAFISSGLDQVTGKIKFLNALRAALGHQADSASAQKSLEKFASDFTLRFTLWISKVLVTLQGMGPVPEFAPPFHPFGRVIGGNILPIPGILTNIKF